MLGRFFTFNPILVVAVILGGIDPLAAELNRVGAGHIIDHLLLHVAVWCFHISALVVILGSSIDLVGGVAHPILPSEAPLHLVSLLQCLVVDGLHQVAHQLVYIKADTLHVSFDDPSAVPVFNWKTCFCVLCPACSLLVVLTLVLEHDLLDLMAVGVLVYAISPNISLPYVRVVPLGRPWCRILRRRRCTQCKGKNKKQEACFCLVHSPFGASQTVIIDVALVTEQVTVATDSLPPLRLVKQPGKTPHNPSVLELPPLLPFEQAGHHQHPPQHLLPPCPGQLCVDTHHPALPPPHLPLLQPSEQGGQPSDVAAFELFSSFRFQSPQRPPPHPPSSSPRRVRRTTPSQLLGILLALGSLRDF